MHDEFVNVVPTFLLCVESIICEVDDPPKYVYWIYLLLYDCWLLVLSLPLETVESVSSVIQGRIISMLGRLLKPSK